MARRVVLIRVYRATQLHTVARQWRGARRRLAMMTVPHVRELAQASGLQIQRVQALLRCCSTFVTLPPGLATEGRRRTPNTQVLCPCQIRRSSS